MTPSTRRQALGLLAASSLGMLPMQLFKGTGAPDGEWREKPFPAELQNGQRVFHEECQFCTQSLAQSEKKAHQNKPLKGLIRWSNEELFERLCCTFFQHPGILASCQSVSRFLNEDPDVRTTLLLFFCFGDCGTYLLNVNA